MTEYAAVERSVTVPLGVEQAFELFTSGIGSWWPLGTHSVSEKETVGATFEPEKGGRVFEIDVDGNEADWGEVLEWDPPHRFAMSWQVHVSGAETQWEAAFTPGEDGTTVTVVHTGWERLGELAAEAHAGYGPGWEYVLGHYEKEAG